MVREVEKNLPRDQLHQQRNQYRLNLPIDMEPYFRIQLQEDCFIFKYTLNILSKFLEPKGRRDSIFQHFVSVMPPADADCVISIAYRLYDIGIYKSVYVIKY